MILSFCYQDSETNTESGVVAFGRVFSCSVLALFLVVFYCICRSSCHPFLFSFLRVLTDDEVVINIDQMDLHHANY